MVEIFLGHLQICGARRYSSRTYRWTMHGPIKYFYRAACNADAV